MPKLKIAVLAGGPSAEREVSLVTGKAIFENLDKKKYAVDLVEMTKDSRFFLIEKKKKVYLDLQNKDRRKFDLFFIALHGTPGEDGTVQGMFDVLGIKYTGPNTLSSALCINKVYSAQIYHANGLPYPEFVNFKINGWKSSKDKIISDINSRIGYPVVIKPVDQGSAVGVSIVKNEAELKKTVEKSINLFPWLMAQKFVKGQEATCGVIEIEGKLFPFPPTHILPKHGKFYDYKSKYEKGGSTHICPADFFQEVNLRIQDLALKAHIALGCRGMSRSDIFVGDNGRLDILETNTIPGMTPTSLFPEAALKAGINFSEMLDLIILASL